MTAFLMICRRFLTTFQRFRKILQNLSEGHMNIAEHFPKIFKDYQRLRKIAEDSQGIPGDIFFIITFGACSLRPLLLDLKLYGPICCNLRSSCKYIGPCPLRWLTTVLMDHNNPTFNS